MLAKVAARVGAHVRLQPRGEVLLSVHEVLKPVQPDGEGGERLQRAGQQRRCGLELGHGHEGVQDVHVRRPPLHLTVVLHAQLLNLLLLLDGRHPAEGARVNLAHGSSV